MTRKKKNARQGDYEVGYGRPPEATRFKPGQSGNPKGRKARPKSTSEKMQKEFGRLVTIKEGGKIKSVSTETVMFRSLATQAAKGDYRAIQLALRLRDAPEFQHSDHLDREQLSPDEQQLLDQVILGATGALGEDGDDPTSDQNPEEEQ